ncbi:MAG: cobalamin-binding protein [Pirellulales bacterium]|nr:cobalamin-binding protein [Pirellulales bacterium]
MTRAPAQRIASLLASGTEIVALLGLAERLVGISHECDFPPQVLDRPRLTSTAVEVEATSAEIDRQVQAHVADNRALYQIDVERLAQLTPDLIVTQAQCDVCAVRYADVLDAVASRAELQPAHVVALNPMTLDAILTDIVTVGAAAGVPDRAAAAVAQLCARREAIAAQTSALRREDRPRVVCLEWIDPPMVAANWMPELLELAGAAPGLTQAGRHSTYTPWEEIVRYDPEVLIVMPCGFSLERTLAELPRLESMPGWKQLAAVQRGRLYAVDGNAYFNRSGPRMLDSLEILAHLVHPERVAAPACVLWPQTVWQRIEPQA